MKHHISPKQAKELTEEQFYSLFDEIVKRDDWFRFHHKKVTIGKMIEFLDETTIGKSIIDNLWHISLIDESIYHGEELIDALWKAVKDKI